LRELIVDVLEELGVSEVWVEPGNDYRKLNNVAPKPKLVVTDNKEHSYHIVDTLKPGFQIAATKEIVIPAQVSVYKYERRS